MTMHYAPPQGPQRAATRALRFDPFTDTHRSRRARLEAALERLGDLRDEMIAKLDAADGDADLEPSLAHFRALGDDREDESEDEGADDEREPDVDREPDDDAEPEEEA